MTLTLRLAAPPPSSPFTANRRRARLTTTVPSAALRSVAAVTGLPPEPIGLTNLVVGEQVEVPPGRRPGVVVGASSLGCGRASEAVLTVRLHADKSQTDVPGIFVAKLARSFADGERVLVSRTAGRFGGVTEEPSVVVAATTAPKAMHPSGCSSLHVRLDGSGETVDVVCTCVRPASGAVAPAPSKGKLILDHPTIYVPEFVSRFPELAFRSVQVNEHALPGTPLFEKFAATLSLESGSGSKELDLLLHGTTSESNARSILANGLHGGRRSPPESWLTSSVETARHYGGPQLVGCLVLRDADCTKPSMSITNHAHHLPVLKVG